jgi:hypothetical protein
MDNNTPGTEFYNNQITYLEANDLGGIVDQYHDDAVIIGFDFQVRGREAIRNHMEGYLQRLGSFKLLATDKFTETPDSIFFEATCETSLGVARVYDVFMLRDGKATYQFTGVISVVPGDGNK